jgi:RimJ/RimL family protein N-acetyltransferase
VLRPIDPEADAEELFAASHPPAGDQETWTYLPSGPYEDAAAMRDALTAIAPCDDPLFFAIAALPDERPAGVASYLRVDPRSGVIEIGHIWFGAGMRDTPAATEAIYLLADNAFRLGYRRLEWKCDALNAASRRAAERFGFSFEGVFRQHMVVKGRNRDTAWYAILDREWPAIRPAYEEWLAPANFDSDGRQAKSLRALVDAALVRFFERGCCAAGRDGSAPFAPSPSAS